MPARMKAAPALHEVDLAIAPMGVVGVDATFRVTRWDGAAERIFGWRRDEVLGRTIGELRWVHDDDMGLVHEALADMLSGRSASYMSCGRHYRRDGALIHCEWYTLASYDPRGRLASVLSYVLDVTDRVRTEAALREREAALRALVAAPSDG